MALDRAGLLAALGRTETEEVALPGGQTVMIRVMTVAERGRMEAALRDNGKADFRERLLATTLCDESGARLFADADLAAVGALSFPDAEVIAEAAVKLNRMGPEGKADLGNGSAEIRASG